MNGANAFEDYEYLERQLEQQRTGRNDDGRLQKEEGRPSSSKHRSRSRDRHRHSSRHRSRSREKSRHRSRSREKSRHRSRSSDRHRSHSSRDRSRHRSASAREATPPEIRAQREAERELRELERATRTIFVSCIFPKADERDLFEFFSTVGKVTDIQLIRDKHSGKSKGLAYVEFSKQEEVFAALALNGAKFMGQSLMIKASEVEKNLQWEVQQQAKQAQQAAVATAPVMDPALTASMLGGVPVIMPGMPAAYGGVPTAAGVINPQDAQAVAAAAGAAADLDDSEEGGLKLNAQGRAALMRRLAANAGLAVPPAAAAAHVPGMAAAAVAAQPNPDILLEPGVLGPASPIPTQCVVLKSMFGAGELKSDADVAEVEDDVKEECSKFGTIQHLWVDRNSKGFVYIKFANQPAAEAAFRALNLRWYSGRQIVVQYAFVHVYNAHFGLTK